MFRGNGLSFIIYKGRSNVSELSEALLTSSRIPEVPIVFPRVNPGKQALLTFLMT